MEETSVTVVLTNWDPKMIPDPLRDFHNIMDDMDFEIVNQQTAKNKVSFLVKTPDIRKFTENAQRRMEDVMDIHFKY